MTRAAKDLVVEFGALTPELLARGICMSGRFETGQGTCAAICMEAPGDVRSSGCAHSLRIHGDRAREILKLLGRARGE